MAVEIIVPWRPGCAHRERAWRWLRSHYESEGLRVVTAAAPPGPWSKGAAVGRAVERSTADVIAVADADCWIPDFATGVEAIEAGAAWGMAHGGVYRLTEGATDRFLDPTSDWRELIQDRRSLDQRAYPGVWGGGIVFCRRDVYLECPIDPRFLDWGNEDTSWARALSCFFGDGWRGDSPLVHLWHPPEPRIARDRGSDEGWRLFMRYHRAADDPVAMRSLLEEARCLLPA